MTKNAGEQSAIDRAAAMGITIVKSTPECPITITHEVGFGRPARYVMLPEGGGMPIYRNTVAEINQRLDWVAECRKLFKGSAP